MKVKFEKPVIFSTIDASFTGDGIPPIPDNAYRIAVGVNTVAYVGHTGEVWECYVGKGTSETSQTLYWPTIGMCPRAWAQEKRGGQ